MATVYKKGAKGPYIVNIQRALNETLGLSLKLDGDFGPTTEKALMDWQLLHKFKPTGVYDGQTAEVLDIYISRRFLQEQDFVDAAAKLKTEVACVKAVQEVESKGAGFLPNSKTVILFERHVFKKQLDAWLALAPANVTATAQKAGCSFLPGQDKLATLKAHLLKTQPDIYNVATGGYKGNEAEYPRLAKAGILNLECAQKSASWGLFQIMGYHHALLGFKSITEMVATFGASERNQLMGFCDFVAADARLLKAIRAKDWLTFAIGYNGPAQQGYDVKMAAAYDKHKV